MNYDCAPKSHFLISEVVLQNKIKVITMNKHNYYALDKIPRFDC